MSLSAVQRREFERACGQVADQALVETLREMVDIASPTGDEGSLARAIGLRLRDFGLEGEEQVIDARQSNALGILRGSGAGPSLLLYSPMDTVTTGDPAEDAPWAGRQLPEHMYPRSSAGNGYVIGLGAQNPKGHAACIVVAAAALRSAGISLRGDLRVGFGAGGMPTNARPGMRADTGHGAGCAHLLTHMARPDCAVIAKSGWSVSWEEVGLAWYEIWVGGTHTYVGSRHLLPYTNPIHKAARLVEGLESWFPVWADRNRSGLVAPQGVVSYIHGGWQRMPAFVPAACQLRLDLRLSPRTTPEQADASLHAELRRIAAQHDIDFEIKRIVTIPGTTTDPDHLIIRTAIEGWQTIEGKAHLPIGGLSGATDANILRAFGIPTARVGLPKADIPGIDFQQGMNTVSVSAMRKLTHLLIYMAIATCA